MRKDFQKFLGFDNFYRKFVKNYSLVVLPLTSLTLLRVWTPEAGRSFSLLKELFCSELVLAHPDTSREFVVEDDSSDSEQCCLSVHQMRGGFIRARFFSRRFSSAERNYDVGNRELLPIKLALEEWSHWLEGAEHPFLIWTENLNT